MAVPKKTINKQVYLAADGGRRKNVYIAGIGNTSNMRIIMEALTGSPEKVENIDSLEFCIPMTYDKQGALNPESGIKMFTFNTADPEKLAVYYVHQQKLFAQIGRDLSISSYLQAIKKTLNTKKLMEQSALF